MESDALVRQQYREQQALARKTAVIAASQWQRIDRADITTSWKTLLQVLLRVLTGAQATAAQKGADYVDGVVRAAGATSKTAGRVVPQMLAGIASDGRDLETLMETPLIGVFENLRRGVEADRALRSGLDDLVTIVSTQVADAGRVATGLGIVNDEAIAGYERFVTLPACSRCIILAGRLYTHSTGFLRHPRCLPAGVTVSGPSTLAATRRWYEGELTVIETASGQRLPITGNHPILTDAGWIPANLIKVGDHVIRGTLSEGAVPLVVPHEHQVPSPVEDLWRPHGVFPVLKMPTTAEDFHGDGMDGEVGVVLTDRFLRSDGQAALHEPFGQAALAFGVVAAALLAGEGATFEKLKALLHAAHGVMGGSGLSGSLFGGHLRGAYQTGFGAPASSNPSLVQASLNHDALDVVPLPERILALSGQIGGHDLRIGERYSFSPRWDAPGLYRTLEDRFGYASRGLDLSRRLSGQVERDRVVEARRVSFRGHVYNLNSSEGWYSANGLIVSNCDCTMRPVTHEEWRYSNVENFPTDIFASMSELEQNRVFGRAGAQAVRDGADLGQVVNARRGIATTTGFGGRRLKYTTEGTTKRGLAGRRMGGFVKQGGSRYQRTLRLRLMPEEIYREAALQGWDRSEIVRQFERFGFIT